LVSSTTTATTTTASAFTADNERWRAKINIMDDDAVVGSVLQPQQQQRLWTVCPQCAGESRIRKRQSRKARFKRPKNAPLPTDPCKSCNGSGLCERTAVEDDDPESSSRSSGTPMMMNAPPPVVLQVAVIGGGIAGLALAAACQHRGMAVTVYERDAHFAQRQQGYGLTLQQAAPQLAALGIPALSGITSTKHIVHDASGNVKGTWGLRHWLKQSDKGSGDVVTRDDSAVRSNSDGTVKRRKRQNVHIARQALRYELLTAAEEASTCIGLRNGSDDESSSVVQWNHRLMKYQETDDHVQLTFQVNDENGETRTLQHQADILVGADGIRSQVRQQLIRSDMPLRYLGCIVILGICPLSSVNIQGSSFAHLLDGETVFQTADGTTRIYMMPYSTKEYMWQLSFPVAEEEATALSTQGPVALQQEAIRRCGTWHSPVPDILYATPIDLVSGYPVYDRAILRPEDLQRSSSSDNSRPRRVTCLGDAIHCMSPFKGQGANQALLDALSLARALYKIVLSASKHLPEHDGSSGAGVVAGTDIEQAILLYETEMLERSAVKVKASAEAAHFLHTDIAIQEGNVTRGAAAASREATKAVAEGDGTMS
jgi:2-polyprenyl-6-methoxyphenol hydroxylase-like FAD-dependent oxidoreductase